MNNYKEADSSASGLGMARLKNHTRPFFMMPFAPGAA
jgi:hypothetical protein